jgi:ketosteroid isomerase-like protein
MNTKLLAAASLAFSVAACHTPGNSFNASAERRQIAETMIAQQDAWNHANLEGFMAAYWKSDSLCFIGSRGLNYGWQTTLNNYQRSYPDAAAMGRFQFTNETIDVLDQNNAFVIGKWELFRTADTLSGHYTLLWKKKAGEWVVVADHSS